MLIRDAILARIRAGEVDRAYRRWNRLTVKAGGRLVTSVGVLDVVGVDEVDPETLTDADAAAAGEESLDTLLASLDGRRARRVRGRPAQARTGPVYCVRLAWRGEDPRIAMREDDSAEAVAEARAALERLDAASREGPWTAQILGAIAREPGRRAPELAEAMGWETARFKAHVRKLKARGLTESLRVGYRLSKRGEAVWQAVRPDTADR